MAKLFQLNVHNVDHLLPRMKERLMSPDEELRIIVVEQISKLLRDQSQFEIVISKLIKFDVISTLCDVLKISREPLLTAVLESLCLASDCRKFYENDIAMDAVNSMLQLAHCMAMSATDEFLSLEKLVHSVCTILTRATKFNMAVDTVCTVNQILAFVEKLNSQNPSYRLRFMAANLLNVVLARTTMDESVDKALVYSVFCDILNSIKYVVERNDGDDDDSITNAIACLCNLCAVGTRFCEEDYVEVDEENPDKLQLENKSSFTTCVYRIVMQTIVPHVKSMALTASNVGIFYKNFIVCLNNVYKLDGCNSENLANHLAANGYMKYFLLLTTQLPANLRRSTCILLTETLTTLAKYSLSIDKWPDGINGFSSTIFNGLLSLPMDSTEWIDVQEMPGDPDTALLILLYYHYHGTRELTVVCLDSLTTRISKLPEFEVVPAAILKPLWFLFAVSRLSNPLADSNYGYIDAVNRLCSVLKYSGLSDCYTHHIDLLHYCLKTADIPNDFRYEVMDLWLIESQGDIRPLLELDCHNVVRHCLLIIVQNGCPGGVLGLAVKAIRQLMHVVDPKDVASVVWEMLPKVLSSNSTVQVEHIKAVLELSAMAEPDYVSPNIMKLCTNNLMKIFSRKDIDANFRRIVVQQAHILLAASIRRNSFKVLQIYIDEFNTLEKLCGYAFSEEEREMSTISLKFLAFVIHSQSKSSIECDKFITIRMKSIYDLLLTRRNSEYDCMHAMQFVNELLTQTTAKAVIALNKFPDDAEETRTMIDAYEMLHAIHARSTPGQRDLVYMCLSSVLKYCHVNAEALMYHLCTVISNYELVIRLAKMRCTSERFLHFVTVWLRYRKRYSDDEGPWNPRALFKSPFDETLDELTSYAAFLESQNARDGYSRMRYALSLFGRCET